MDRRAKGSGAVAVIPECEELADGIVKTFEILVVQSVQPGLGEAAIRFDGDDSFVAEDPQVMRDSGSGA